MTNELHKTILDEKRDEVAKRELNQVDYEHYRDCGKDWMFVLNSKQITEAALLAMEEVDRFNDWRLRLGYIKWSDRSGNIFYQREKDRIDHKPLELYQIYKEEKKQGA